MTARAIRIRGRVQGVGFRPHVHKLATALGLDGDVRNDADGVLVRLAGDDARLDEFRERVRAEAPPLAAITAIDVRAIDERLAPGFVIVASERGIAARTEVAPDAVVCAACRNDVLAPGDRRHRYPFTTCTHCGPRLTIVTGIPYDRARTTMARFPLCGACRREYEEPTDRRFHAEAVACPACGPRVGEALSIDEAAAQLRRGAIVAVKGLGGYQLACDATNAAAVARLRERKSREAKAFALMARDLDVVRRFAVVNDLEARALASPEGPIVLLDAAGEALPEAIAPGLRTHGFLLPTTPLHVLLLASFDGPLVMTSGNVAEEPQAIDDADAKVRLGAIADAFLAHDRPIASRVDDSVVRAMGGEVRVLRRARGFAPAAIALPFDTALPILAYGAELKATFCLARGGEAILSQHLGDLGDAATLDDYVTHLARYASLFEHAPMIVAHDLHPDYASTGLAKARGLRSIGVQHHHAHVAACMVENDVAAGETVLGIVLDGMGLGADGSIWGGELLVGDYRSMDRLAWLTPTPMIGGDVASIEPWRNLYAHLARAELPMPASIDPARRATIDRASRVNAPLASSCGRLFDAFAALLGIAFERQAYEGEAAARLEALAATGDGPPYPFAISSGPPFVIDPTPMWRAALADGASPADRASSFHRGLASALVDAAARISAERTFSKVALSGGCFQNRVLLEATLAELETSGYTPLVHRRTPPNDGCIALGQATVAAASIATSSRR